MKDERKYRKERKDIWKLVAIMVLGLCSRSRKHTWAICSSRYPDLFFTGIHRYKLAPPIFDAHSGKYDD